MMQWMILKDYVEVSKKAADIVAKVIQNSITPKLGLATGSSPEGMYRFLVKKYKDKELDFETVQTVNLDEYVGIDPQSERSYHTFMHKKLFDHVNIRPENIHIPKSEGNPKIQAKDYDSVLDSIGKRNIQIIGVGENGHIAFNEPARQLGVRTSIINLNESTIEANARFFEDRDQVPKQAISMGIGDLLNADTILLIASGERKQDAVRRLYEEKIIDTNFPVSLLYTHSDVIVVADEKAFGKVMHD